MKEGKVSGRERGLKNNDNKIKVKTAGYTGGVHAYHLGCEVESGIRPELNRISSTDHLSNLRASVLLSVKWVK